MYSVLLHALILLLILWILSFWMEAIQELIIVEKDLRYVFSHIHLPKLEIKISLQQTSLHTATTSYYLTEDTTEEEDLCDELILSEILGVVKRDDERAP